MCFTYSIFVYQTQKDFECLIVFGKSSVFAKISKTMLPCSSDLVAGQASHMPQSWAYKEGFRNSQTGQCPSCKKNLENFSKIWVFRVVATWFGDLFASESSSREGHTETFATPFATSSRVDLPVAKNT